MCGEAQPKLAARRLSLSGEKERLRDAPRRWRLRLLHFVGRRDRSINHGRIARVDLQSFRWTGHAMEASWLVSTSACPAQSASAVERSGRRSAACRGRDGGRSACPLSAAAGSTCAKAHELASVPEYADSATLSRQAAVPSPSDSRFLSRRNGEMIGRCIARSSPCCFATWSARLRSASRSTPRRCKACWPATSSG